MIKKRWEIWNLYKSNWLHDCELGSWLWWWSAMELKGSDEDDPRTHWGEFGGNIFHQLLGFPPIIFPQQKILSTKIYHLFFSLCFQRESNPPEKNIFWEKEKGKKKKERKKENNFTFVLLSIHTLSYIY